MRELVGQARVARLGTINPQGAVDLVPVVFAVEDGDRLVTAVDHKPKTTHRLRRLDNIARDPRVTVLVDHYADDWHELWWVRVRGRARVTEAGPEREAALAALRARYEQYRQQPPEGPAILVDIESWRGWSAR